MTTTDPQARFLTRDDYYRMAAEGLFTHQRVEFVGGEIRMMSPMNPAHAASLQLVARALESALGKDHCVRVQLPLRVDNRSEPEPDIAVVPGTPRDYRQHPTTALIVVEISDTTLDFDRTRKRELYARAGIPEYWIVNLPDCRVEVQRVPLGGDYTQAFACDAAGTLASLAAPHVPIRVADLLP
ncbi:MAG: Uma2 family endonuclease [Planctomycetes bacterium]|nr:Uma2 family endonuclease [Planctomycetota bacterium]